MTEAYRMLTRIANQFIWMWCEHFVGFAQAKRKGWMSQISPAKEPATIEKISKKVRRKSEKLPPPSECLQPILFPVFTAQIQHRLTRVQPMTLLNKGRTCT